jgi:hypothetical protein
LKRRPTAQDIETWGRESGMGSGARADPLGDEYDEHDDHGDGDDEDDQDENSVKMHEPSEIIEELQRQEIHDKSIQGSVY